MQFDQIGTEGGGSYLVCRVGEFEGVNPIKFYEEYFVRSQHLVLRELLLTEMQTRSIKIDSVTVENVVLRNAAQFWTDKKREILDADIPAVFIKLLNTNRKKDQAKLLRGFSLTAGELLSCIFYAYRTKGYLLSQYEGQHDPVGTERDKKPTIIHIDGDDIIKVGDTKLRDGQLRHIVQQRSRTVAKLIEKDGSWHCFFITLSSLRGTESWKDGQPHFHYISDKFGISKSDLKTQIRSRRYKLGNLPHIDLLGYREEE